MVSHLKKAIKAEKYKTFRGVEADELKLWKVTIPDDQDDLSSNLSKVELLATKKISKYFPDSPLEEHIHVLVEPPVSPKRKANKWTVNIEQTGLGDLKDYICELYRPPALENDGAVLNFMNDEGRYSPRNDASFREMLRSLVTKKSLKFTVVIETPSKPFNSWTFPKVCELYGLSDDPNPSIDVYPVFRCGSADLNSDESKAVIKHLMAEIKLRQDVTPLDKAYEATKTIYSYCYLVAGVSFYKDNFKLIPEKLIEGRNGQGNLDYAVECRSSGKVLGVIEVKKDDFMKGFAQASVQPYHVNAKPMKSIMNRM